MSVLARLEGCQACPQLRRREIARVDTHGLLKRLDREWQDLLQSLRGLSDKATLRPGLVGEWSGKDLLGHVATWEDEAIKAMGR